MSENIKTLWQAKCETAAEDIMADLDDRAGFSFAGVEDGIKADMIAAWATIIVDVCSEEVEQLQKEDVHPTPYQPKRPPVPRYVVRSEGSDSYDASGRKKID